MAAGELPGIDDYPETLPLPDGDELVIIGWAGARSNTRTVDHADWYLRPAGDQGDLVDPWPIYGRRSDATARGFVL